MNQQFDRRERAQDDTQGEAGQTHSLWAVNRKEITVKGVEDVLSFDDHTVDLVTSCGRMTLEGQNFRVTVLDTAGGVVSVTGTLCGVLYELPDGGQNGTTGKGGRLARLFR